jgi:hypothetical protein
MRDRRREVQELSNQVKPGTSVARIKDGEESEEDSRFDAIVDGAGNLVFVEREKTEPVVPEAPVLGVPTEVTQSKWEGATVVSRRSKRVQRPLGGLRDDLNDD